MDTWYLTFTDRSLHCLFAETFLTGSVKILLFGNVRVATAYLYGMGLLELTK